MAGPGRVPFRDRGRDAHEHRRTPPVRPVVVRPRRPESDPPRPYTPLWRRLREDEWPPLGEVLRGRREQMSPGVLLVLLLPCLWWLTVPLMVGFASGPALRHAFNLSALRAALPALVTTALVWVFAFLGRSAGGLPPARRRSRSARSSVARCR
ncbi:hypothetical protein [Streptomyces noursei]|uniref:hypothetical protein n=1 Tax=Streptomyces noursei TaxID=1971 RepID=UPI0016737F03|nr:hypothetical protein [Streptomyces noursei]MCZ1019051.1 hypothetical protein [Streptomyces noursei]